MVGLLATQYLAGRCIVATSFFLPHPPETRAAVVHTCPSFCSCWTAFVFFIIVGETVLLLWSIACLVESIHSILYTQVLHHQLHRIVFQHVGAVFLGLAAVWRASGAKHHRRAEPSKHNDVSFLDCKCFFYKVSGCLSYYIYI